MFIKNGDKFKVIKDFSTLGMTHWMAPCTGGFECTVPKGTVLIAFADSAPMSSGFGCIPENKKEFELKHVPENERTLPKYGGYSLVVKYSEINKSIEKIEI